MHRRTFLVLGASALAAACGGGGDAGPTAPDDGSPPNPNALPDGVTATADEIRVEVDRIAALGTEGGVLFLRPLATIVVRASAGEYRALTAICTHAGCQVREQVGTRLRCPCHGSEFALNGAVQQGPAAAPLATFASRFDAPTRTLIIQRG